MAGSRGVRRIAMGASHDPRSHAKPYMFLLSSLFALSVLLWGSNLHTPQMQHARAVSLRAMMRRNERAGKTMETQTTPSAKKSGEKPASATSSPGSPTPAARRDPLSPNAAENPVIKTPFTATPAVKAPVTAPQSPPPVPRQSPATLNSRPSKREAPAPSVSSLASPAAGPATVPGSDNSRPVLPDWRGAGPDAATTAGGQPKSLSTPPSAIRETAQGIGEEKGKVAAAATTSSTSSGTSGVARDKAEPQGKPNVVEGPSSAAKTLDAKNLGGTSEEEKEPSDADDESGDDDMADDDESRIDNGLPQAFRNLSPKAYSSINNFCNAFRDIGEKRRVMCEDPELKSGMAGNDFAMLQLLRYKISKDGTDRNSQSDAVMKLYALQCSETVTNLCSNIVAKQKNIFLPVGTAQTKEAAEKEAIEVEKKIKEGADDRKEADVAARLEIPKFQPKIKDVFGELNEAEGSKTAIRDLGQAV